MTEVKDGEVKDFGNDLFGNHVRPRGRRDSQCPPQNKGLLCGVCEDKHIMKPGSKVCGTCAKYEGEISLLIAFTAMCLTVAFVIKMRAYVERKYFDSPDEAQRVIRAAVQRRSVPLRTCTCACAPTCPDSSTSLKCILPFVVLSTHRQFYPSSRSQPRSSRLFESPFRSTWKFFSTL